MQRIELTEIKKRAEIISARSIESLQSNLKSLHAKNAAQGRLRSGATVKESAGIARSTIQSYFSELEQFVRSRPDGSPGFDATIIDAISSSTSSLISSINDGLLKSATLAGNASLVSAVEPEVTSELSASQETFRSNIRAYWATKASTLGLSRTDKVLLGTEAIFIVAAAIIIGMWINDPKGSYEPYLALFGIGIPAIEIFRRVAKRHAP
ncbi:hypothetical protein IP90_03280 [Luteimonas cucumeris]|uniref:Uncharacterized protein n=1 Tax=Luteimonas cucumeris TaxID=985012 RepID=A0A562KTT2_9GAMM|nr:hypothetical protein [Luteimonas cucumeris]TWH98767.1 hypothetical protein IP90_03280 [Luteimonas cucumeris]